MCPAQTGIEASAHKPFTVEILTCWQNIAKTPTDNSEAQQVVISCPVDRYIEENDIDSSTFEKLLKTHEWREQHEWKPTTWKRSHVGREHRT